MYFNKLLTPLLTPLLGLTLTAAAIGFHPVESIAAEGAQQAMPAGPLHVMKPWVRPTVAAQKATGGYMTLMAHADGSLIGAESDVADKTEIHEMKMDGDIMRMRRIESIDLQEGDVVKLEPGGYHVMFMGLKEPLTEGKEVDLTLLFKGSDGQVTRVPVKAVAQKGGSSSDHEHGHHEHHKHQH